MSDPMKVSVEIEVQEIADAIIRKLTEDETLVEVVRCGECRHKCGEHDGYICCDKNVWRDPKWYCADGER